MKDHENIRLFFLISLRAFYQLLNDVNIRTDLNNFFYTTCCIF